MKAFKFSDVDYQVKNLLLIEGVLGSFFGFFLLGKKVINTLLWSVSFLLLSTTILKAQFAGGKGTKEDPYKINSWEQLAQVKDKFSSSFILVENLDRNSPGYETYAGPLANSGLGWMPIPNFTGVFDGNDLVISDLVLNRPTQSTIGLFGKAGNAQFKNIHLSNVQFKGGSDIGALLGLGIKVQISNCSFDGQVEGKYYVGGLVGTIGNSQIVDSYSLGKVFGFRSAGGIAGNAYQTNLNRSFSSGKVNANLEAGGLVGFFHSYSNNSIQNSYSISQVWANEVAGGLVGRFSGATLKTSYAAGSVSANSQAGGLIGWAEEKISILDCFWDQEKTGQSSNSGGGSGLETKALKGKESLSSRSWNFQEVWGIKEPSNAEPLISYPYLKSIKYDQVGQKEGKNPIPGLESAKIPTGINFPLVLIKTYGDPDYILGEEVDRLGQLVTYTAEDTSILRITGNQAMILKAGTTKVKAESTNTYNISDLIPLEQTLTVLPASLQVEAVKGQKKVFGTQDQKLEFNVSGLKYDDGTEVLTGQLQREHGEDIGNYQILKGSLSAGENYQIEFTSAEFEITKRLVTVEAQSSYKIFGNEDPKLTFKVSSVDSLEIQKELSGNLKREPGEAIGKYKIGQGDLKIGANFEFEFKEAVFEIVPAELATVMDPKEIQTPWSQMPLLPTKISALTKDGQMIDLTVTWEKTGVNLMGEGVCSLVGSFILPEGIRNPDLLKPVQKISILPKPAPEDVLLSNNKFEPGSSRAVLEIGKFDVIDKTDDIHSISLVEGSLDNSFFLVNGNSLAWKNDGKTKFKNQYSILVKVQDRGGNVLEKEFLLRSEFVRISDIEIFNTFTPDGDGINDTWGVPALGQAEGAVIQIFDRSGSVLFSTENPENHWDGTFQGKSVPAGTYYWVLNSPKTGETRKGFLNLLRK